jgi:hypothetical protein
MLIIVDSLISMQKLCRQNSDLMAKVVCQNLTSNCFLNKTSNPNACSIWMQSWDRKKLYASVEASCLSLPLFGIRRVVGKEYALSASTKYLSEALPLSYKLMMHKMHYYWKYPQDRGLIKK